MLNSLKLEIVETTFWLIQTCKILVFPKEVYIRYFYISGGQILKSLFCFYSVTTLKSIKVLNEYCFRIWAVVSFRLKTEMRE